ncbi:MAG: hypothetical protein M3O34_18845 [Chloroflexota bacterium]|nr:hypothetical protein [Chloroflexota bacterium]
MAASTGGLILIVATVVNWLGGVGSINDPLNPRWRDALALLAPGFVLAAVGLAGTQTRFTGGSRLGAGGAGALVLGIVGFAASWTVLHEYVFPLAPTSILLLLVGVFALALAMLRAGIAPRPATVLLLASPLGIFIAIGPPRPGALILLLVAFGVACAWLGLIALRPSRRLPHLPPR